MKVYFVGAGPGDPDLITVKGKRLLEEADLVVFAGSLVNPALLEGLKAEKMDSNGASMEATFAKIVDSLRAGKRVVRLHSGDPSLYGAILEQMKPLEELGIEVEVVPGVSSLFAPRLRLEYPAHTERRLGVLDCDKARWNHPGKGRAGGFKPARHNHGHIPWHRQDQRYSRFPGPAGRDASRRGLPCLLAG